MKKALLTLSLLALYHWANAGCSGPVTWTMDIKNSTPDPITISCGSTSYSLGPGEDSGARITGSMGSACDTSSASGISCTYKDTATKRTGTLQLVFNSCSNITTTASAAGSRSGNPFPFGCSTTATNSGGGETYCDFGGTSAKTRYTTTITTGYFDISYGTLYQMIWRNVKMGLVQGQVMADALASKLMIVGDYSFATASYDGSTVILNFTAGPPNPYNGVSCTTVNN